MASSRRSVLVIDDEPSVQRTLSQFLDYYGFQPFQAGTVDAAITTLAREDVDAVILDVRLPDDREGHHRSGLELLAYLRRTAEYAHLPVLVLTGNLLNDDEELLIRRYGACTFYKPQPFGPLIEHLNRVTPRDKSAE